MAAVSKAESMRTTLTYSGQLWVAMRLEMLLTSLSVRGMIAPTRATILGKRPRSAVSIASMLATVTLPSVSGASLLPAWMRATVGVQPKAALVFSAVLTFESMLPELAPH